MNPASMMRQIHENQQPRHYHGNVSHLDKGHEDLSEGHTHTIFPVPSTLTNPYAVDRPQNGSQDILWQISQHGSE